MKVSNQTTGDPTEIKVCLYNTKDKLDFVPVGGGVFVVKQGETVPWTAPGSEALPEYTMKAFKAGLIDGELAKANVAYEAHVVIRGANGKYSITTE